jgi:hypothetical protein
MFMTSVMEVSGAVGGLLFLCEDDLSKPLTLSLLVSYVG